MLDFLLQGLVAILTGYLSLTNGLADRLASLMPPARETTIEDVASVETPDTQRYEYGGAIPDILIKNAAYQKAAVYESQTSLASSSPARFEEAIVNVFCTYTTDAYRKIATGSGVVVSPEGVILTNAHVAQFLLLAHLPERGRASCHIRTGSVATATYEVDLLYISPKWIQENATVIAEAQPKGSGQRDYALLYITKGVDGKAVPASLPYLPLSTTPLERSDLGSEVTIGGYPTLTMTEEAIQDTLERSTATTTIAEVFTFVAKTPDIFNLRGTPIGEHGISGGPVISAAGEVIGLITTKSDDALLGEGSLNAITTSYINETVQEETGFDLSRSIGGDLPYRASLFRQTIVPFLTKMLSEAL